MKSLEFDSQKCLLFLMLDSFNVLNGRELKYLMWRYGSGKENWEIAELDGKDITPQGIQYVIKGAISKIKKHLKKHK